MTGVQTCALPILRVIGNTLAARLLLLELGRNEVACQWFVGQTTSPPLSALALLPGPTLSLAQHSRNLWQQQATQLNLPLIQPQGFYDLATTPGRATKLHEEALLDALAGEAMHYTATPPYGVHPRLVQGARGHEAAPQLASNIYPLLDGLLAEQNITPQPLPPEMSASWLEAVPTTLTEMAIVAPHLPRVAFRHAV